MLFRLFVGLEVVLASHISFVSPINATNCSDTCGDNKRQCESTLPDAPLINVRASASCSSCNNFSTLRTQMVQRVDSAFAWDANYTVVNVPWSSKKDFVCGLGYFMFGMRFACDADVDQFFCKRAINWPTVWGNGGVPVNVSANTIGTAGAVVSCPNGTYLVGLTAGANTKLDKMSLICAYPPDTQCAPPPDQNTTYVVSSNCSSIHQFCVVTLSCKPYYEPLNGSQVAECRPSNATIGAYNTSLLQCVDIDECAKNASYCGPNGLCTNVLGAPPICTCRPGFAGPGCENVDECLSTCLVGETNPIGQCNNCSSAANCVDTPGGFNCTETVNPCLVACNGTVTTNCNRCSALATNCSFSNPSYSCTCPPGYFTTDQGLTCEDIDECQLSPCSSTTSTCENLNGSYACLCLPGYGQINSTSSCTPIDECKNASICPLASQCVDTTPFYYCLPQIVDVRKDGLPTPFTLSSTEALSDVVSLTVLRETSCVRSNVVFYGATMQFQTSPCNVTNTTATSYQLRCQMNAGAGANLTFSLQCCPNSTFPVPQPCQVIPAPAFVFSYPPPTLAADTLTYEGSLDPNGTAIVDVVSQAGLVLTMQGLNFFPFETWVYFGTPTRPLLAPCTLVSVGFSTILCNPQMITGQNYTFTVVVGVDPNAQQSLPGADTLTFTGDPPVLSELFGCVPGPDGSVRDCPTQGGVVLSVKARTGNNVSLTDPQLMIDGNKCLRTNVTEEGFDCILPPGTGSLIPMELADQSGSWKGSMLSYANPQIRSISSDGCTNLSALSLGDCSVPLLLRIEGANFGASGAVVMLDQLAIPAVHVSSFPGQPPSGPDGEHRFLLANITSVTGFVSNVVVNQENGGVSVQTVNLSLSQCSSGYERAATSCVICGIGRYELAGLCLNCSEGFYQSLPGQTACTQCPLGNVQGSTGAAGCGGCGAGTYPNEARSACLQCLPGKFNPAGKTQCVDCTAGTYQSGSAATACTLCPSGQYSTSNAIQCGDCPPGRVTQQNGTAICIACPPGTFQNVVGQSTCKACDPGYHAPSTGSPLCLACNPGSYQNETRQTGCKYCTPGRAQPSSLATTCNDCQPGKITPTLGSRNCRDCTVGTYSGVNGSSTCSLCPPGSAQVLSGASVCKDCLAGTYSNEPGRQDCLTCEPGSFQSSGGASFCSLCNPGMYAASPASRACVVCEPGKFQSGRGQARCIPCSSGLFQEFSGSVDCLPCLAGTTVSDGSTLCSACPAGTFSRDNADICLPCTNNTVQPNEGQGSCVSCPKRSTTNEAATRCQCDVGTYYYVNEMNGSFCVPCPAGSGPCAQAGQVFSAITTVPGWWRVSKNATTFYRCVLPALCLGNDLCQPYRHGPLCSLCMPGYKSSGPGTDCVACPATQAMAWGATVGIVVALVVLLLVLYTIALRVANAQQARLFECVLLKQQLARETLASALKADDVFFTDLRAEIHGAENKSDYEADEPKDLEAKVKELLTRRRDATTEKLNLALKQTSRQAPNFMYKVKILIGFFQIASYLPSQGDIEWPRAFQDFISAFSLFNFDFIPWQSLGCAANLNYFNKTVIVGFVPICAALVLVVFFAIGVFMSDTTSLENQMEKGQRHSGYWRQFVRLLLFTVFLLYPLVSKSAIGVFNCITVEGVDYLVADFNLHCYDSTWTTFAFIDGLFILLYPVGIPVAYFVILRQNLPQMREPETILKLGFLYEAYTSHAWYWELVDMLHKLVLTSVVVFSPNQQRMAWNMGVMGLYLILIIIKMPYIRKGDDRFHQLVQATLFSIAFVGFLLQDDRPYETTFASPVTMERLIGALLIIMVLVLMISFLLMTGRNLQKIRHTRKIAKKAYLPPPMQPWNPFSPATTSTENSSKSDSPSASVQPSGSTATTTQSSTAGTLATGSQRSSGVTVTTGSRNSHHRQPSSSGIVRLSATPATTAVQFSSN